MMNYVQFFTDSMAMTLADALSRAGIGLPVYGQVTDPEAEHDRVEVRCNGTEELIPGNYTTRLDCSVVLLASASANDAAEVEQMAAQVAPVVNGVPKTAHCGLYIGFCCQILVFQSGKTDFLCVHPITSSLQQPISSAVFS